MHVTVLDRFQVMLWLALPPLLMAAAVGGCWLSQRALRPVARITTAAESISIRNLPDRLEVPETGDELQRLSETLNRMLSRLNSSVQRMAQFTADASHELRAPGSLIRTTAELAVNGGRTGGEYRRLLILARADSGEDGLQRELTDLAASVREAVGQGRTIAAERKIELTDQIPADTVAILGDGEALRRLVFILIDNAIKYTAPGGSIDVRLGSDGGDAVCTVSDSGIGIAAEDVRYVFDRFWRADQVRSRGAGGAGLGLSTARWIVERHQGTIEVQSEPGKGRTFTVRLPTIRVSRQEE